MGSTMLPAPLSRSSREAGSLPSPIGASKRLCREATVSLHGSTRSGSKSETLPRKSAMHPEELARAVEVPRKSASHSEELARAVEANPGATWQTVETVGANARLHRGES